MNNYYIKVDKTKSRNIIMAKNDYLLQVMDFKCTTVIYKLISFVLSFGKYMLGTQNPCSRY